MITSRIHQKLSEQGLAGLLGAVFLKLAYRLNELADSRNLRRHGQDCSVPTIKTSQYNLFQASAHKVVGRYISVNNKDVLEVGGAQAGISAAAFLRDGAATVTVSGLNHISEETEIGDQRLRIMKADALDLTSHFEPCSMDIVYGLSIIEHIPEPKRFLEEINRVLKPGGVAYFEGNPLWTSPKGHHLWVATWNRPYRDRATANYLFSERQNTKSINPLPDWGHLLMSEQELTAYLEDRLLPNVDIECIIDWVFKSNNINRLTHSEIAKAYSTSSLILLEANTQRVDVPTQLLPVLRKKCGEGIDYGIIGVSYVLAKPD